MFWESNPTNIESPSGECFAGDGNTLATGGEGVSIRGNGFAEVGGGFAEGGEGVFAVGESFAGGGGAVAEVGEGAAEACWDCSPYFFSLIQ